MELLRAQGCVIIVLTCSLLVCVSRVGATNLSDPKTETSNPRQALGYGGSVGESTDAVSIDESEGLLSKRASGDDNSGANTTVEQVRLVLPEDRNKFDAPGRDKPKPTARKKRIGRPRIDTSAPPKDTAGTVDDKETPFRAVYVPQRPAYIRAREGAPNEPFTLFDRKTRSWKPHPLGWTNREYVDHRRSMMRVRKAREVAQQYIDEDEAREFIQPDEVDTSGIRKLMRDRGVSDVPPFTAEDVRAGPYARARAGEPDAPFLTWERVSHKWIPTTMTNGQYLEYRKAQMRVYNNQRNRLREYAAMERSLRRLTARQLRSIALKNAAKSSDAVEPEEPRVVERDGAEEARRASLSDNTVGIGTGRTSRNFRWSIKGDRQPRKSKKYPRLHETSSNLPPSPMSTEASSYASNAPHDDEHSIFSGLEHISSTPRVGQTHHYRPWNHSMTPFSPSIGGMSESHHSTTHDAHTPLYDIPMPASFEHIDIGNAHIDWGWLDSLSPLHEEDEGRPPSHPSSSP